MAAQTGPTSAQAVPVAADAANSPVEEDGKTYRFVGARFRYIILPKFMMNLFGDGGATVGVPTPGLEFGIRKSGFETNLGLQLGFYSMDPTPFKASSDPDTAFEIVDASLKVLYVTADFLWSAPIDPKWQFLYGAGTGLGIVFGDIHRQQSQPPSGNGVAGDPYTYTACPPLSGGNPAYCNHADNNHFGDYTEPSWANGGSKPILFPWLMLQTGLRYKPARQFAGRIDLGFGTSGFMIGIGGDYGLPD